MNWFSFNKCAFKFLISFDSLHETNIIFMMFLIVFIVLKRQSLFMSYNCVSSICFIITFDIEFILCESSTVNLFFACTSTMLFCFSFSMIWIQIVNIVSFNHCFFFDHNENFASIVSLMMYDNKYDFIIFIMFFFVLIVEILLRLHDIDHKYESFDKFQFFIMFVKFTFCSKKKILNIIFFAILSNWWFDFWFYFEWRQKSNFFHDYWKFLLK